MTSDMENRGIGHSSDVSGAPERRAGEAAEAAERPAKRAKRGRYVSRACVPCQKRKIKCDGGQPCSQCATRNHECSSRASQGKADAARHGSGMDIRSTTSNDSNQLLTQALLQRLSTMESQLGRLMAREDGSAPPSGSAWRRHSVSSSDEGSPSQTSPNAPEAAIPEADGQIFAGETSIERAIEGLDQHTPGTDQHNKILTPDSNQYTLLQPQSTRRNEMDSTQRKSLHEILTSHGITPDKRQWKTYLTAFMTHVQVLYPFLHPPIIWNVFDQLWEQPDFWTAMKAPFSEQSKLKLSLVLLCLAIGRCTASSRVEDSNGTESAGWNIYSVAVSLLGDHLDISKTGPKSLTVLQVLVLMVVYLFRLDANQQAARILAMVISESQSIGLHRQKTFDDVPIFHAEMSRRLWWSIYVLDRRIALETGRPFVIQDLAMDTAPASELCEDRRQTSTNARTEILSEIENTSATPIPYLNAMVNFSEIVGRAWEILYGAESKKSVAAFGFNSYMETLLTNFHNKLPKTLRFDPEQRFEVQFEGRTRSQSQQALLLYMRSLFLRVLIRKPNSLGAITEKGALENMTACSSLAAEIIETYQQIPESDMKFTFPFGHYLASAVMILLGLVTKEVEFKRRYSSLARSAAQDLVLYSRKTWVSGKMMRCISRLVAVAEECAGPPPQGDGARIRPRVRHSVSQDGYIHNRSSQYSPTDRRRESQPVTADRRVVRAGTTEWQNSASSGNAPGTPGALSMLSTRGGPNDFGDRWTSVDSTNPWLSTELPEWAMTDFDFELDGPSRRSDSGRQVANNSHHTNNNMNNIPYPLPQAAKPEQQNDRPYQQPQQHHSDQQQTNDRVASQNFLSFGEENTSYLFDFFAPDQEFAHPFLDTGYMG